MMWCPGIFAAFALPFSRRWILLMGESIMLTKHIPSIFMAQSLFISCCGWEKCIKAGAHCGRTFQYRSVLLTEDICSAGIKTRPVNSRGISEESALCGLQTWIGTPWNSGAIIYYWIEYSLRKKRTLFGSPIGLMHSDRSFRKNKLRYTGAEKFEFSSLTFSNNAVQYDLPLLMWYDVVVVPLFGCLCTFKYSFTRNLSCTHTNQWIASGLRSEPIQCQTTLPILGDKLGEP